jgi:hypothetical protein
LREKTAAPPLINHHRGILIVGARGAKSVTHALLLRNLTRFGIRRDAADAGRSVTRIRE